MYCIQIITSKQLVHATPSSISNTVMAQYIDYLVLGKTGMGKSTTADRLLVAESAPGAFDISSLEQEGGNTQLDDILIWRLSNRNVEDVKARVKFFLVNRAAGIEGLAAVNPLRQKPDSTTMDCVLLSNEKTRNRVLDVPGFHTSNSGQHSEQAANQDNLGIMRQILRIQALKNLHFRRILYFLPTRGPPEKADSTIQEELKIMHHFFGRVIFDSMIVVATERARYSKLNAFSDEDIEQCRVVLKRAFQLAFAAPDQNPDDLLDVPNPPIIYLSLELHSSAVLDRLRRTDVTNRDGLELRLDENTCAHCSLKFGVYRKDGIIERLVSIEADSGCRSAYSLSKCHPFIKPKYSTVKKILGGIVHIVLLGIPYLVGSSIPGFFNHDEECAECKMPPGSPGCMQIGQKWGVGGEEINVDHTSELHVIPFKIVVKP